MHTFKFIRNRSEGMEIMIDDKKLIGITNLVINSDEDCIPEITITLPVEIING